MQFGLNEEQRMFRDAATGWLADTMDDAARARAAADPWGFSRGLWGELATMGWLGAGFPEALGGSDGGAPETAIMLEAAGGALLTEPLIEAAVLAPHLLHALTPEALPALLDGSRLVAPAWFEGDGCDPLAPQVRLSGDRLTGTKTQVAAGHAAELLVTATDASGAMVLAALDPTAPGVTLTPARQVDGRVTATLHMTDAPARVLARGPQVADAFTNAFDHAVCAACAEALGIAGALFGRTLDYARTRTQFGRPIAGFQVIQHRLADLHIALEEARSLTTMACKALDNPPGPARAAILSSAKSGVLSRCLMIARDSIHLHGGVGMTEEMPIGRGFRRLRALSVLYGDESWHLARVCPGAA